VGANLVRALLDRNRDVRALVRRDDVSLAGLPIEQVRGDVRDPDSLRPAFEGVEVVYHLAAKISIDGGHGGLVWATNVDGVRNVADAALAAGVRRLIHFCSIHAFEQQPADQRLDETRERVSDRRPAYDRSKAAGEAAMREAIGRGLDAVIVYPTAVIGPHDYAPSRMGQIFLNLYHRKLPSLIEGGFNWVDVRDVIAGAMAAEERGRTGEGYLLSGHWRSVRDIANIAAEITGAPPPKLSSPMWLARIGAPFAEAYSKAVGGEPLFTSEALLALRANRCITNEKAGRELGYTARSTRETVQAIYQWLAETGRIEPETLRGEDTASGSA
jgi:dihydroflavonol-4-reductase